MTLDNPCEAFISYLRKDIIKLCLVLVDIAEEEECQEIVLVYYHSCTSSEHYLHENLMSRQKPE